jgi:hypothetical protein
MDSIDHKLEEGIEEGTGLFRVASDDELHRAPEVREKYGDLFALALKGAPALEDFRGEVARRLRGARDGSEADAASGRQIDRFTTPPTEFRVRLVCETARMTSWS